VFGTGKSIETDRLRLRAFVRDDLDELYDIQSRPEVSRYQYWEPRTRDEVRMKLEERISQYSELRAEHDVLILAVVRKDTSEMIGDVMIDWQSEAHRRAEVGYVVHPGHRGNGFAAEATGALLRMGFADLRLHRIIGRIDARNTASGRVLEKLGMRREAHFRENEMVKGEWCDEVVYAILAREYFARDQVGVP
jgi:RimJ/RimL family protein N-acetyltransferase